MTNMIKKINFKELDSNVQYDLIKKKLNSKDVKEIIENNIVDLVKLLNKTYYISYRGIDEVEYSFNVGDVVYEPVKDIGFRISLNLESVANAIKNELAIRFLNDSINDINLTFNKTDVITGDVYNEQEYAEAFIVTYDVFICSACCLDISIDYDNHAIVYNKDIEETFTDIMKKFNDAVKNIIKDISKLISTLTCDEQSYYINDNNELFIAELLQADKEKEERYTDLFCKMYGTTREELAKEHQKYMKELKWLNLLNTINTILIFF